MATYTANAAAVGTCLFAGAGTITGIALTQPTPTTDMLTPLQLLDLAAAVPSAAAAALPPVQLFCASVAALMPGDKPGMPYTPGVTAPTWPRALGTMKAAYTKGIYVASCPANATFTITG